MRQLKRYAPEASVVVGIALLGMSLARVVYPESPDYLLLGGSGAIAGLLIVGLLILFRSDAPRTSERADPQALKGMKVMAAGVIVGLLGVVVAILVWFPVGFVLGVLGILTAIFGLVIHFAYVASGSDG